MKPSSAKAKGRRLQDQIREMLREHFRDVLEPDDITSAIMGQSGSDIIMSPAARRLFPYSIEAKNQEKLNIWSALKQAEQNCKEGTDPMVVFKKNHSETFVALRLSDFMKLLT